MNADDIDAVLISLPNCLHEAPIRAFLECGVPVAVDKPPVVTAAVARELVELANRKGLLFATMAQRRFEEVYVKMAEKIREGALGSIQLIELLFVHGWTPALDEWRSKKSLSGGGVLIDSVFNCLDVLLWLLRQTDDKPKASSVVARWELQNPDDPDTVETRIVVEVTFSNGCLLSIAASSTAFTRDSIDECIKIFGTLGVLRYRREMFSRRGMGSGQLTFQGSRAPTECEELVGEGKGKGLRNAPLDDFFQCLESPERSLISPACDSIECLEIIEKAYLSAMNGGIPIQLIP